MASAPAMIIASAITKAKIGRSMKKRDMAALASGGETRRDLDARVQVQEAINDQPVPGIKAALDQPFVTDRLAGLDHALDHEVARADHHGDGLAAFVAR